MSDPRTPDDATPDPRPRPQYGEYATPEEQRARIQQPDATWALETGQGLDAPAYGESTPGAVGTTGAAGAAGEPGAAPGVTGRGARGSVARPSVASKLGFGTPVPGATARAPFVDRVITFALLGYGLVNVIFTAVSLFDFAAVAETYMRIAGIPGQFTNIAEGQLWGPIAAITMLVGWVVTALFALRRVRRGRRAWWIPLVGATVTYVVSSILLSIPLINDPAIAAYVAGLS